MEIADSRVPGLVVAAVHVVPDPVDTAGIRYFGVGSPDRFALSLAKIVMNDDVKLQKAVLAELNWDPSVPAGHIRVMANGGVVTLTGHAGSYAAKYATERAAARVQGVKAIAEELEVQLDDRAGDAATRRSSSGYHGTRRSRRTRSRPRSRMAGSRCAARFAGISRRTLPKPQSGRSPGSSA